MLEAILSTRAITALQAFFKGGFLHNLCVLKDAFLMEQLTTLQ